MTEPGIYLDLSNEDYHAGPGISNTGLGDILQSPKHYYARHHHPSRPKRKQTGPQEDGHIAHCAVLEPDEFTNRYVIGPDVNRNTKAWKEFCQVHGDKTVIKVEQYNRAMIQRDNAWAIPEVAKALSSGNPEVSAYAIDPETGVLCRVRPDWVHDVDDSNVILLDAKTYTNAEPWEFRNQIARMNYHRQAAYYSDIYKHASGKNVIAFIFLSIEMPWPHACSASMLDDRSLLSGLLQYQRALKLYAECKAKDEWPGYSKNIEIVSLPEWAQEEENGS